MNDRYSIGASADKLEKRFKIDVPQAYQPRYNAAPTQLLPVITNENPQGFSFFYWGVAPKWAKNKSLSPKLYSAQVENILEKASHRNALKQRRCLVPVDGFYDWKSIGKKSKVPYRIVLNNHEPFTVAGIWEEYEEDGEMVHTFSIITTRANLLVNEISDRMPAILTPESEKLWLDAFIDTDSLLGLLKPYDSELMHSYTVSSKISILGNDRPELINPAPAADQFGNYTLFN